MTIVRSENIVRLIQTEDQNVKTFVPADSFAVEIQNALHVIMLANVNAKKDFMLMEKFARRSNVKPTTIAVMINVVTTTCANLFA